MNFIQTKKTLCVAMLAVLGAVGCNKQQSQTAASAGEMTTAQSAAVTDTVRIFMQTVAQDITQNGPAAWRGHFLDSPSFFMVADGQMAFPDSAAATAGIQGLAQSIKTIQLQWGSDMKIDPLTPEFAVVAAPYREHIVMATGKTIDSSGFFTATAQYANGKWIFRDAHWSVPAPAMEVK